MRSFGGAQSVFRLRPSPKSAAEYLEAAADEFQESSGYIDDEFFDVIDEVVRFLRDEFLTINAGQMRTAGNENLSVLQASDLASNQSRRSEKATFV